MIMSNKDKNKRKQGGGRAPQLPKPTRAIKTEKQGTTGWNQLAKFAQDYPPDWWKKEGVPILRVKWNSGDKKAYEEKKLIFL